MRGLVCGLKNLKNVQVNLSNKSGKNKNNKNINLYQGARAHLFKNKVPGGNWGEMKDCPDNRVLKWKGAREKNHLALNKLRSKQDFLHFRDQPGPQPRSAAFGARELSASTLSRNTILNVNSRQYQAVMKLTQSDSHFSF